MSETIALTAFTATLAACLLTDTSILLALAAGYLIFCTYGLKKGCRPAELLRMSARGVRTVKNILVIFALIGMITALWRASGTIPVIICYSAKLINPSAFLLITFLLNCMVSTLTGTSFGTAATMGVVCMAMAVSLGLDPFWVGGAILSGIFFGDRCSPVSSSALLVCELTKTDIFSNFRKMMRSSLVPFALSCLIYYLMGLYMGGGTQIMDVRSLFADSFRLHWTALLPAMVILVLSVLKIPVKRTLAASIAAALAVCLLVQDISLAALLRITLKGYQTADPRLAAMMNGGGILSMVKVAAIVTLSSSYAGIFEGTGLLDSLKKHIERLSHRITPFGGALCVSVVSALVTCNQSLTIMLTDQLCHGIEKDPQKFAIDIENTAVIIPALVPWSIAGAVPLAAVSAPTASILAACYLYLLPAWNLLAENLARNSRRGKRGGRNMGLPAVISH